MEGKSLISSIDLTSVLRNLNSDLIVSWNIDLLVTATRLPVPFNSWEHCKRKYIKIAPNREIFKKYHWSCKHAKSPVRNLQQDTSNKKSVLHPSPVVFSCRFLSQSGGLTEAIMLSTDFWLILYFRLKVEFWVNLYKYLRSF